MTAYPSVQACPGPVDLAMLLVAADKVPAAIDDCIAAGVPVAIVCSSGFAEDRRPGSSAAGRNRGQGTGRRAARRRTQLHRGGRCRHRPGGFIQSAVRRGTDYARPRSLGFVSQSGALGYGTVSLAFERGIGLRQVVTTGNEADVSAMEAMCAIAEEPECTGVLGYVESLTDGPALRRLAALGVPVALLKAGRSDAGQRAAASHTGALAAGDRVVDAALRQLGIVRVDDIDELLDVAEAFAQPRRPAGPRAAVVTTSGGSGILAADAIERARPRAGHADKRHRGCVARGRAGVWLRRQPGRCHGDGDE